jgi:alpha-tubulin suppressor-like RCC1 family protein
MHGFNFKGRITRSHIFIISAFIVLVVVVSYSSKLPIPLTHAVPAVDMAVGKEHACAVVTGGDLYCWGRNLWGELGNASFSQSNTPVRVLAGQAAAGDMDGTSTYLANIAQVEGGSRYTCALSSNGNVYCWGLNSFGDIGNNQAGNTAWPTPQRVLKGGAQPADVDGTNTYLANITSITIGDRHTCAVSSAGNAYCWGLNSSGQIGDNTISFDNSVPVQVHGVGDVGFLSGISLISAGVSHTCATTGSDVYCWGGNFSGQLGDGTTTDSLTPVQVLQGEASSVAGDNDGTYLQSGAVEAGSSHTCVSTSNLNSYCWGLNSSGQLGNGTTTDSSTPVRVLKGAAQPADNDGTYLTNAYKIIASASFSCENTQANNLYCWGDNTDGQLGDGTTSASTSPIQVVKGEATSDITDPTYLTDVLWPAKNNFSTQMCAITSTVTHYYCWGDNTYGQLGDSTTTDSLSPFLVVESCGFKMRDSSTNVPLACEFGDVSTKLRIYKDTTRGIITVPTSDARASFLRIRTFSTTEAAREWGI